MINNLARLRFGVNFALDFEFLNYDVNVNG